MKKTILFTAAIVGVLIFEQRFSQQSNTMRLNAKEVFAVDGDTIGHGDERYRLVGFDTPETFRAQCDAEKALGLKAKDRLTEIIQTAGQVKLEIQSRRDKYGRYLAVGKADGQEVGAILISEGLARPYEGGKRQPWCT